MKNVGLLTTFFEAESGYSLIAVAGTQPVDGAAMGLISS